MLDYFLKLYVSSTGVKRFAFRAASELLRRLLILFGDPPRRVNLKGNIMILPASHKLPFYMAEWPYYDELPVRLSKFLRERDGHLAMIDVGANVGDTISACFAHQDDRFIAVEANPDYVSYLKQNCSQIKNVVFVEAYCSSQDVEMTNVKIDAAKGTARVMSGDSGDLTIPRRKLDSILRDQSPKPQYNFLKIDTDGHDFEVVFGAGEFINNAKPAILMECDVFDNQNYVRDFSAVMERFVEAGYETVIAYDNRGYLFDVFSMSDYRNFRQALLYQLISKFGYYDLLILDRSHHSFVEMELAYFIKNLPNQNHKSAAKDALDL